MGTFNNKELKDALDMLEREKKIDRNNDKIYRFN